MRKNASTKHLVTRTGDPLIDQAIEAFIPIAQGEGWNIDEYAENMCNHASDEFLHKLAELGIEGQIEHWDPSIKKDVADYPYCLELCMYHWAVRVGVWVIDWTAAQFDDDALFPLVWRPKKREWRNVED